MAGLKIPVSVELGNSLQNLSKVQGAVNNLGKSPELGISKQLSLARAELKAMIAQFGELSPQVEEAARKVAKLQKITEDAAKASRSVDFEKGTAQFASALGTVVKASAGVVGGLAAIGVVGEDAEKTLLKIQGALAFAEAIRGLGELGGAFSTLASVGSAAFKSLAASIGSTGVGLLLVGIGVSMAYLISKMDDANEEQDKLKEGIKAWSDGYSDANVKINNVAVALGLAKKGVISKEAALKTYNETLGDTFGKTDNLNEAEQIITANAENFIRATAAKAKAQALFALAASAAAKAIELQSKKPEVGIIDELKAGLAMSRGFTNKAVTGLSLVTAETNAAIKAQQDLNKTLEEGGKAALEEALAIEAGFKKTKKDKTAEELAAERKKNAEERKKQEEQFAADRLAAIKKSEENILQAQLNSLKESRYKSIQEEEVAYQQSIDLLLENKDKKLITTAEYNTLREQLDAAHRAKINGINASWDQKDKSDADKAEQERLATISKNHQARLAINKQFSDLELSAIADNGKRRQAEIDKNFQEEIGKWTALYLTGLINEENYQKALLALKGNYQKQTEENTKANIDNLSKITNEGIEAGLEDAMAALGDALASGEDPFQALTKSLLTSLGNMATALGKEIFTLGVIFKALEKTLKKLGPGGKIAVGLALIAFGAAVKAAVSKNAKNAGFARGGYIYGPGTETSDSIPARLSRGEYVIRAKSVKRYGKEFFDRLNRGIPEPEPYKALVNRTAMDPSRALVNRSQVMKFAFGGYVDPFVDRSRALVNRFESNPLGLDSGSRALVNRPLPDTPRVVTGNVRITEGMTGGIIAETKISGQDLKILLHRADRRYSNAT